MILEQGQSKTEMRKVQVIERKGNKQVLGPCKNTLESLSLPVCRTSVASFLVLISLSFLLTLSARTSRAAYRLPISSLIGGNLD